MSNFKTTSLVQPWQTLCNMFSRCLTTRVTGFDKPPLQIMQMLYCFVNNIHVDWLWEGLHYSIEPPSTLIPYPIFIKLIVSYYMTAFPKISRRARDKYHNLEDDMMVKNIFNSRKHKDGVGMKILSWMITDEMKLTENYRMYVVVFVVDVPTTQSQPIESTQGTHRTTSAPRSPNPAVDEGESIKEHLITEEIEKLVEGAENVENDEVDSTTLRQNDHPNDHGTRLEPWSNKESLEVELTVEVQPVNINKEEEESAEDDYELKRKEKGRCRGGLILERQHSQADVAKMIADAINTNCESFGPEISSQINNAIINHILLRAACHFPKRIRMILDDGSFLRGE
ncbi:hypothetical protein Tco_0007050 [Tanacetum coccineum]